ncbi:hypothetical protein MXMO3_01708 [Maritalea myrionectae]|uniref:Uncharacterized protein n=1 Tax=Maritalea myrionectae TaxID=454601 RepID=A0A2R4ME88_9HYPH|nr:hypothetical protein [Maritalea myrionectae]AVX04234.1 hypothetical protein MXMO3_01708 [Maritalea myrionectae]
MAYATTNPPNVVAGDVGTNSVWVYASEDIHTDVDATDYFSNGDALGMRVNDVVIVVKTTATIGATIHVVTAVTTDGAATISPAILA